MAVLAAVLSGLLLLLGGLLAIWVLQGLYRVLMDILAFVARFTACMLLWIHLREWSQTALQPRWNDVLVRLDQQPQARLAVSIVCTATAVVLLATRLLWHRSRHESNEEEDITTPILAGNKGDGSTTTGPRRQQQPTRRRRWMAWLGRRLQAELAFAMRFLLCQLLWIQYAERIGGSLLQLYQWIDQVLVPLLGLSVSPSVAQVAAAVPVASTPPVVSVVTSPMAVGAPGSPGLEALARWNATLAANCTSVWCHIAHRFAW